MPIRQTLYSIVLVLSESSQCPKTKFERPSGQNIAQGARMDLGNCPSPLDTPSEAQELCTVVYLSCLFDFLKLDKAKYAFSETM